MTPPNAFDVLQRPTHQQRVRHALAVVGEDPDTCRGGGHRAEFRHVFAVQSDGDGADRLDIAQPASRQPPDLFHDARGVSHRIVCWPSRAPP